METVLQKPNDSLRTQWQPFAPDTGRSRKSVRDSRRRGDDSQLAYPNRTRGLSRSNEVDLDPGQVGTARDTVDQDARGRRRSGEIDQGEPDPLRNRSCHLAPAGPRVDHESTVDYRGASLKLDDPGAGLDCYRRTDGYSTAPGPLR